jgi:uncharacterized protein YqeY
MLLTDKITQDMTAAMKAREEQKLSTLRMMRSAIQLKEVDKRGKLEDSETLAVLSTMIKQRHDSIEQFNKGGRPELAKKEAEEITLIETYMPKTASQEEVQAMVKSTIAEMENPTIKEMGTVMKNVMAKFQAAGQRVDGKAVSEAVKSSLSGK